jgi:endonuclease/exonuclease/phosphatase (EEP) superfamily protein YafD
MRSDTMPNLRPRIATYNVLAQCFFEPDRYAAGLPPAILQPAARQEAVIAQVTALDADILLLQEVEPALLGALEARLGHRYRFLLSRRPTHTDGCVIGVSRAATVLAHDTLVYRDREPGYSQVAGLARIRLGGLELVVASTHLRCGCQATCGQPPLGLLQMRELLAALGESPRCVLGGDLNATPDSATIQAATDAGLRLAGDAPTACIRGVRGKRDYLLHAGLRLHALPTPAFAHLPSATQPSDHVPLQAWLAV